jgi:hypothetical protein
MKERPLKAVQPRTLREKLADEERVSLRQKVQRRRVKQIVESQRRDTGGEAA